MQGVHLVPGRWPPQYVGMATEATRRFLWFFLPIAAVLATIGGYWIKGHSPHEIDRALAKDHPLQFAKVRSAAQAIMQLDSCLLL